MAYDEFTNGTTADADDVNTAFQTTVSNALTTASFSAVSQHLNFTDNIFVSLGAVADTLFATITGVTMETTDLNSVFASINVGYVPPAAGTTAVSLQTNYIPAASTVSYGTAKTDYILCSQYGGVMDLTDTNFWTKTGTGTVTATSVNNNTSLLSNDFAGTTQRITILCGLETASVTLATIEWVDDSGTNEIARGYDPGANTEDFFLVEIFLDTTAGNAYIFVNGVFDEKATYDTTFKIKIAAGASVPCYAYCYCVSDNGSTTTTITDSLTADGGSNWESVTNGEGHTFTNTGTSLAFKSAYTLAANEFVIYRKGINMGGWY